MHNKITPAIEKTPYLLLIKEKQTNLCQNNTNNPDYNKSNDKMVYYFT